MKQAVTWRTGNDSHEANERVGRSCCVEDFGESLTQQQFTKDADLNVLAERFGLTGKPIPPASWDPDYFGDVSEVPDLRSALDLVNDAKNKFMALDPELRLRFDNDPAKLWTFIHDPLNRSAAIELGLLKEMPPAAAEGATAPLESPPKVSPNEDTGAKAQ